MFRFVNCAFLIYRIQAEGSWSGRASHKYDTGEIKLARIKLSCKVNIGRYCDTFFREAGHGCQLTSYHP